MNKDFGFRGVQINNDAYIDVNQLDNNTNNDEENTEHESLTPLKYPVKLSGKTGEATKGTTQIGKESAIVIPGNNSLTPVVKSDFQRVQAL